MVFQSILAELFLGQTVSSILSATGLPYSLYPHFIRGQRDFSITLRNRGMNHSTALLDETEKKHPNFPL